MVETIFLTMDLSYWQPTINYVMNTIGVKQNTASIVPA